MKVLLGFSGGVDSAISAYLLKKEGHEVTGAFMRNWDALLNNDYLGNPTAGDSQCPQEKDYQDALSLARKIGIPLVRIDFVKEYWDEVFSLFLDEYRRGRTPNPDILCNSKIKFGPFLDYAKEHGFERIAMGHYARKAVLDGLAHVAVPKDKDKDQTYFLADLKESQIAPCLFPMEGILKTEARELARSLGLSECADKHGSTGICFIGERNFRPFLENFLTANPGKIVDGDTGEALGMHEGVLFYTLGQRKGLGIGGVSGRGEGRWYVYRKDVKENILYVAQGEGDERLLSDESEIESLNWIGPFPEGEREVVVRFRYRMKGVPCLFSASGEGRARLRHLGPVKAATPGQWAAIYNRDGVLLGGGIIDKVWRKGDLIS